MAFLTITEKDAELTIRYCHELIDYGEKTADSKLLGFGYYHLAMILYCLNDYDNIFDIVVRAIDHLEKAQSWSMLARACNILGIITSGRGNQPVAYDYYLDGLMYCKKIWPVGKTEHYKCQLRSFKYQSGQI